VDSSDEEGPGEKGVKARSKAIVPRYVTAIADKADKKVGAVTFEAVEAHFTSLWAAKRKATLKKARKGKKVNK